MIAAGGLYVSLTDYKAIDPETPSALSFDTPGDKVSRPVENRFEDALERGQPEAGEVESMDENKMQLILLLVRYRILPVRLFHPCNKLMDQSSQEDAGYHASQL